MAANYGNWLGILKWSIAQGGDGTAPSEFRPMSEEDRKWLTEAFESITVDEAKRMGELAQVLLKKEKVIATPDAADDATTTTTNTTTTSEATIQEKLNALEELEMIVESIDNAKNLFMVGGFDPLLDCIRSSSSLDIKRRAADTLAVVLQNNPKAQSWALEHSPCVTVLSQALAGITKESQQAVEAQEAASSSSSSGSTAQEVVPPTTSHPNTTTTTTTTTIASLGARASALTALSSLVRDSQEGQRRLINRRGDLDLVMAPIREWHHYFDIDTTTSSSSSSSSSSRLPEQVQRAGRRLVRKSLFFLRHLVTGSEADNVMSALLTYPSSPGLVPHLLSILSSSSSASTSNSIPHPSSSSSSSSSGSIATHDTDTDDTSVPAILTDADVLDARDNTLHILQALANATVAFEGVAPSTDSDNRKPRPLGADGKVQVPVRNRNSEGRMGGRGLAEISTTNTVASTTTATLSLGNAVGAGGAGAQGSVGNSSSTPMLLLAATPANASSVTTPMSNSSSSTSTVGTSPSVDLVGRRAILQSAGAEGVLLAHSLWAARLSSKSKINTQAPPEDDTDDDWFGPEAELSNEVLDAVRG